MTSTACPHGRLQAANLAIMNLRAVVSPEEVTYLALPHRRLAAAKPMGPRFQPRNELGQFCPYAALYEAMYLEYAGTAYEYDIEDHVRAQDEALANDKARSEPSETPEEVDDEL